MPTMTLTFTNEIQTSVQVGDMVLYCNPSGVGGFSTSPTSGVVMLGACVSIDAGRLAMEVNYANGTIFPTTSSFILFSKDKYSNPSGVLGYYAEVCFKNNSTDEAELFGVNTDMFMSSK
jgi:hypothetical protein